MRQPRRRLLQIPDMLILIAAMAVTVALMKRHWAGEAFKTYYLEPPPSGWTPAVILARAFALVAYLGPYPASAAAVALLAIRLRGPKPARPRLARQPGLAACAAVTLVIALNQAEYLARVMLVGVDNPFRSGFSYETLLVLMDGVAYSFPYNGYAVAAAWLTLAIGGRWRPEPGWVDRWGRAIGVFWLMMIPLYFWLRFWNRP